jgi:hypothetical protein
MLREILFRLFLSEFDTILCIFVLKADVILATLSSKYEFHVIRKGQIVAEDAKANLIGIG